MKICTHGSIINKIYQFYNEFLVPSQNYCKKNRFSKLSGTLKLPEKVSKGGIIVKNIIKSVPFSVNLFVQYFAFFEKQPVDARKRTQSGEDQNLSR